ncbi:MAG: metallophosphoesterase [Chloroflexota bacterium]
MDRFRANGNRGRRGWSLTLVALVLAVLVSAGIPFASPDWFYRPEAVKPLTGLTFAAVGDIGKSDAATATLQSVSRSKADFLLALGDLKYQETRTEEEWCDFVKAHLGATFPVPVLPGNHDADNDEGDINKLAACLPRPIGRVVGDYPRQYYFDHGALVRIIAVSPDLTLNGEHYRYQEGDRNYEWLAGTIDGAREAGVEWVIVAMHKNCIAVGTRSCEIGPDLLNLLVAKRVDLVLQAHEHNYQRTGQIALGEGCSAVPADGFDADCVVDEGGLKYDRGAGTVFVIAGTGGRGLYDVNKVHPDAPYLAALMGRDRTPTHGPVLISLNLEELSLEFVPTANGQGFRDQFTIDTP